MNEILKDKLASAQIDAFSIQACSSKKESELLSIRSELAKVEWELASAVSELECLKAKAISEESVIRGYASSIVGGDEEKNITKFDSQSEDAFASNISVINDIEIMI